MSYARRGSRFTSGQQRAWDAYADAWVIPDEALDADDFDIDQWFGRAAPLFVEIGCGVGEATAALAQTHPEANIVALEVWPPGVAATLGAVGAVGADNVRLCSIDAAWFLRERVVPGSVAGLWTFFPDPWPKTRHHKRRLIQPNFAQLVAERLRPGADWRIATDWADYADQIDEVLAGVADFEGGRVERWPERPLTKFERKGLDAGRDIADFCVTRPSR